eukprot:NODE_2561_length_1168_cov_97.675603_g2341_i0.p1 GENE.NODE_2561_length_1168_cov_97.675603_g2341_i0~~NODE_2561_length_1168_cov_97.675603_g2341_i0.p1  ORF type:complete len:338 (-),score=59.58 NODE_2561_length_1168_cov_97.675603_g2341_i0:154-1041(-)
MDTLFDGQAELSVRNSARKISLFLTPKSGPYTGARIQFDLEIPDDYPQSAPKVQCVTRVYHPNIGGDLGEEWNCHVCLNILGSDWHSSMRLEHAISGLLFLFVDEEGPNFSDPLNDVRAENFSQRVQASIAGAYIPLSPGSNMILPLSGKATRMTHAHFPCCLADPAAAEKWWEKRRAEDGVGAIENTDATQLQEVAPGSSTQPVEEDLVTLRLYRSSSDRVRGMTGWMDAMDTQDCETYELHRCRSLPPEECDSAGLKNLTELVIEPLENTTGTSECSIGGDEGHCVENRSGRQ